jgi:hypothetical protein
VAVSFIGGGNWRNEFLFLKNWICHCSAKSFFLKQNKIKVDHCISNKKLTVTEVWRINLEA